MYINETTVKTGPSIILWDGITSPDIKESGKTAHNLRVAISNNDPSLAELHALANKALLESKWKGTLPPGGNMPFAEPDVNKFGPLVAGHTAFTASSYRGAPPAYDVAGNKLDAIQFNAQLYAGAKVALLVDAFAYDNKQKGIAFGLSGFQIIDANAPKLDVGGGMTEAEVANAFGGAAAPATTTAPAAGGAMQSDAPPPPANDAPPPPSDALSAPPSKNLNGKAYTQEALVQAGYTQAQIDALPNA